jgi:ABC-type Fe3+/spermidine/putrescine transport system ATPase subunit
VEIHQVGVAPLAIERSHVISTGNGLPQIGQPVTVAIRPEKVSLWGKPPECQNLVQAELRFVQFLGDRYEYTVALGAETRVLVSPAVKHVKAGEKVYLELKSEGITLWPREA